MKSAPFGLDADYIQTPEGWRVLCDIAEHIVNHALNTEFAHKKFLDNNTLNKPAYVYAVEAEPDGNIWIVQVFNGKEFRNISCFRPTTHEGKPHVR